VTNGEYLEFVHWVRDSIARVIIGEEVISEFLIDTEGSEKKINWEIDIPWSESDISEALSVMFLPEYERFYGRRTLDTRKLVYEFEEKGKHNSLAIYPDTLCWINDFVYSYIEPMTNLYFWHPAYKDYPVVGVSKDQAIAYCKWKTQQLRKQHGSKLIVRLPKEYERESTILYSYRGQLSNFSIGELKDKSWVNNLSLYSADKKPQVAESARNSDKHFNRNNILTSELIVTIPFYDKDYGYGYTSPADLSQLSYKSFLKSFDTKYRKEKFTKAEKTIMLTKYNDLIQDLTPNNISGLAGNVSEWMFEDYETNWNSVFVMRQLQIKLTAGEDARILSSIEDYYDYTCDKNGGLIRGSNWFDSRKSNYLGVNVSGLNTKRFIDSKKSYSTVGFRYVIELLE